MINKDQVPILINRNISSNDLDSSIRSAITFTYKHQETNKDLFINALKVRKKYDLEYISSCFEFVMSLNNARDKTNVHSTRIAHKLMRSNSDSAISNANIRSLHSSAKIILVHLWHTKTILLPLEFKTGTTFSYKTENSSMLMNQLLTPVASFISLYPGGSHSLSGHEYLGKWNTNDLRKSGWRLFLSSSFHDFCDFNIEEFCDLVEITFKISPSHRDIKGYKKVAITPVVKTLYSESIKEIILGLDIDKKTILSFDNWRRQSAFSHNSFCEFRQLSREAVRNMNRKRRNERKKQEGVKKSRLRRLEGESFKVNNIDFTESSVENDLRTIISGKDHPSAVLYFTRCQYLNYGYLGEKPYPGCEFTHLTGRNNIWTRIIENYLAYRENKGFTIESAKGNARILIDYLFFYLPFWISLNPDTDFPFPHTPADFSRKLHFKKTINSSTNDTGESLNIKQRPLTLLDLINVSGRRSKGHSVNAIIEFIDQLFLYAIADKDSYPEVSERHIQNPVHQKIDKVFVKRHTESVKENIPESLFYLFRAYLQALEKFGMEWLEVVIENPSLLPNDSRNEMPEFIHAWELGLETPSFEHNGCKFSIDLIPNVYFPNWRTIKVKNKKIDINGEPIQLFIPVLSPLRLTYCIVGSALRGQSVQWLDRESFDIPTQSYLSDSLNKYDFHLIRVNTDKVKKEPWDTLVHSSTRDVLLREREWQNALHENSSNKRVKYENRKNSPHEDILPLFRSKKNAPVNDKLYHRTWELAWMSFHRIIQSNKEHLNHDKSIILKGLKDCVIPYPSYPKGYEGIKDMHLVSYPCDTSAKKQTNKKWHLPEKNKQKRHYSKPSIEGPFCEIKYKKRYTPHCTRVSHVTILADHGVSPELIKEITGQTVPLVRYYTKKTQQRLAEVLHKTGIFNLNTPIHLHPSDPDSAMNHNLSTNIEEAIQQHRFASFDLREPSLRKGDDALTILKAIGVDKCDNDDHRLCVAGGKCPIDAIEIIHEHFRCALCHYALFGLDHQPGILARIEALRGEVTASAAIIKTRQNHDTHQSSRSTSRISNKQKLDLLEISVYEQILNYLEKATIDRSTDNPHYFFTREPEIIKEQLELRSQNGGFDEHLYLRFTQCMAYGDIATDSTIDKTARRLARKISVQISKDGTLIEDLPDTYTLIDRLWNQIATIANLEGRSIQHIYKNLLSLETNNSTNTRLLVSEDIYCE